MFGMQSQYNPLASQGFGQGIPGLYGQPQVNPLQSILAGQFGPEGGYPVLQLLARIPQVIVPLVTQAGVLAAQSFVTSILKTIETIMQQQGTGVNLAQLLGQPEQQPGGGLLQQLAQQQPFGGTLPQLMGQQPFGGVQHPLLRAAAMAAMCGGQGFGQNVLPWLQSQAGQGFGGALQGLSGAPTMH